MVEALSFLDRTDKERFLINGEQSWAKLLCRGMPYMLTVEYNKGGCYTGERSYGRIHFGLKPGDSLYSEGRRMAYKDTVGDV